MPSIKEERHGIEMRDAVHGLSNGNDHNLSPSMLACELLPSLAINVAINNSPGDGHSLDLVHQLRLRTAYLHLNQHRWASLGVMISTSTYPYRLLNLPNPSSQPFTLDLSGIGASRRSRRSSRGLKRSRQLLLNLREIRWVIENKTCLGVPQHHAKTAQTRVRRNKLMIAGQFCILL